MCINYGCSDCYDGEFYVNLNKAAPVSNSRLIDGLNALPPNTAELLLALHGEFYGRGLANADAFRILPDVVKKLRLHGEIE